MPSMSSARRLAKCRSASWRWARQVKPPVQRATASPSARSTGESHTGHTCGSCHRLRARRPALGEHAHHLRDHVPGAAHDHRVPGAHVLALHLVDVVQRDVAHRHAADEHRLQARHGRQRPGAPHLELDAAHHGEHFIGGKLVRDRPARCARDEAHALLVGAAVQLVDHAVDLVGQRAAACAQVLVVGQAALDAAHGAHLRGDRQARAHAAAPAARTAAPAAAPLPPRPRA